MASTYSDLKIELITTGEQSGTWGSTTNTNLGTALEEAIVGRATANFTTDADLTLTLLNVNTTQVARNYILNVTSGVSLTTTRNLIVPTIDKPYIIENNTTGAQSIVVKTSAGTGVTVPNGKKVMVYANSTNVVAAFDYIPAVALGTDLAVVDGGTGASDAAGARTNLGVTATGADTTYAYRANNLSDLASASTARTNLGVTATGADTTYAFRANNLSDLANAGTARTNLGLGTIATQNSNNVTLTGGTITGITDLAVADGGTGASTASDARTNLGLGTIATQNANNVTLTGGTITGITDLAVADGGTGSSTLAANAVLLGNGTSALQTVAPSTSGNVLQSDGTTWVSNPINTLTAGTAQASTSGTSIDFTGIPSWVKRITVMFDAISTSGTSNYIVQLGDSGGFENTGYFGCASSLGTTSTNGSTSSTLGITLARQVVAGDAYSGICTITNITADSWVISSTIYNLNASNPTTLLGGGDKATSATLDRIRITTVSGTDTFDAGSINILYE